MKKFLGVVYFLGSILWCVLLIPIALLAPLGKLYEILFLSGSTVNALTYLLTFLGILLSCFFAYCILKFGLSLFKTSINMMKGIDEKQIQQERLKALVEKKLNKNKQ